MSDTGRVPLSQVEVPAETQARVGDLDEAYVHELVDAIHRGEELPPIRVVLTLAAYVCVDGFHRYAAHLIAGKPKIAIEQVAEGDAAVCAWHAAGANVGHGLRRQAGDVKRAVLMANEARPGATVAEIAKHCGCSLRYVKKLRAPKKPKTSPKGNVNSSRNQTGTSEKAAESSALPGNRSDSEEESPTSEGVPASGEGDPRPGDGTRTYVGAEHALALPLLDALRRAEREAKKASGIMKPSGAYLATELRKLRRSFELNLPEVHAKCGGEGCDRCEQRGWLRARSEQ